MFFYNVLINVSTHAVILLLLLLKSKYNYYIMYQRPLFNHKNCCSLLLFWFSTNTKQILFLLAELDILSKNTVFDSMLFV